MSWLQVLVVIASEIIESLCVSYTMVVMLKLINKNNCINTKSTFIKFWLINFAISMVNRCIHIFLPDLKWLKFLNFTISTAINCIICYKVVFYKGVIISILMAILSAVLEVIIVLVLTGFDITPITIVSNVYYNGIYAAGLAIIEALLGFAASKFSKATAGVNNKLKYFMPQLIVIILSMFPTMALLMFNYFKYSALFIVLNLIQLLVVAFVGIYNLKFVMKHENTEMELANTITYNETLKKVNDGVRGFKHDMGNIVQSILGYIAINDSEGAKNYCQNLVIGFNDINVLSILSPKVIDDPAIYGVVVNKILSARDKNMTLSLDVNMNVSEINFPKFELSRILGILIDNAIEAGEQTEDKKLIVNMYHDYDRHSDVIIISNSIKDVNIDTVKIFKKNYSTKNNPSGFGLYEVNKFLKHNPQAYLSTSIDKVQKLFTQTLIIASKVEDTIDETDVLERSTVA